MKNLHDSCYPQHEWARISNILHSSLSGSRFGTVELGHKVVMMCKLVKDVEAGGADV